MPLMQIVATKGRFSDWEAVALLASGAIAADYAVSIFAMNEAVWGLRKDLVGKDSSVRSSFQDYETKMNEAVMMGQVEPWWELLATLKHMGDLRLVVCALTTDVLELTQEDLMPLVDEISGVTAFAVTAGEADVTITM